MQWLKTWLRKWLGVDELRTENAELIQRMAGLEFRFDQVRLLREYVERMKREDALRRQNDTQQVFTSVEALAKVISGNAMRIGDRFDEMEAKLADIAEGCERFDAELSDALLELRELSERHSASSEENSKAITDLVEMIEKMRRSRLGAGGSSAFEMTRQRAERATYKGASKSHDELVALAEGR